ncbi:hypothetical protein APA_1989 [Pseudanabaena sp. lw0831]|nr:hypothetical protein APA_1989 [Pseudanabaena sp. lw0831]
MNLLPQETKLYGSIKATILDLNPPALLVLGLTEVAEIDNLLAAANVVREAFRESFAFPVLLWLDDRTFGQFVELAPDFYSWATTRELSPPTPFLFAQLQDLDENLFARLLAEPKLATESNDSLFGKGERREAFDSLKELQLRGEQLSPPLQASVDFFFGRDACDQGDLVEAQRLYNTSLEFWQTNNYLDREGLLHFHLGLHALLVTEKSLRANLDRSADEAHTIYASAIASFKSAFSAFKQVSTEISDRFHHQQDYVLLCLVLEAETAQQEGNQNRAIACLRLAQYKGEGSKPLLYVRALKELRDLYFSKGQYLRAFKVKQKRRSIEQQYELRAFIGAGRLAASKVGTTLEIEASGRDEDIRKLIERIGRNDYKLIVLYGLSGVGKSSLVEAGLLPALREKSFKERDVLPITIRKYKNWQEDLLAQIIATRSTRHRIRTDDIQETLWDALIWNETHELQTVIILDQFEEFFFEFDNPADRQPLFSFVKRIYVDRQQIPTTKVLLSLREDYLHYLLGLNQLKNREGIQADIPIDVLSQGFLYQIGNLKEEQARNLIEGLTRRANFQLDRELIDRLTQDLKDDLGEIRPVELQVVGAQLQLENVRNLTNYERLGDNPKAVLVRRYLDGVVADCGSENQELANLLLYLLTDERGTRPIKTQSELAKELRDIQKETDNLETNLDLILKIAVGSGLVILLPESPTNRYQLIHDYLAAFIHTAQAPKIQELYAELSQEKGKRQRAEEDAQLALEKKQHAEEDAQIARQTATRLKRNGSVFLFVCVVAASVFAVGIVNVANMQVKNTNEKAAIAKNEADLAKNEAGLAKNEADLAKNEADLAKSETGLAKNEAGLAKNEAGLAKNEAGLAKNEAGLAKNEAEMLQKNAETIQTQLKELQRQVGNKLELQRQVENKLIELKKLEAEKLLDSYESTKGLMLSIEVAHEMQANNFGNKEIISKILTKALNKSRAINEVYVGQKTNYPIATLPNGKIIIAWQEDKGDFWNVDSWNPVSFQQSIISSSKLESPIVSPKKPPIAVYSKNNQLHIITGHSDGSIRIRDTDGIVIPTKLPVVPHDVNSKSAISSVGVNEDGTIIVAGYINGDITAWKQNAAKSYEIIKLPDKCGHFNYNVDSISINRDGSYVVIAPYGSDDAISPPQLWNRAKDKCDDSLIDKGITSSSIFSDPKNLFWVVVGDKHGTLSTMNVDNEAIRPIDSNSEQQHTNQINSITIIDKNLFMSSGKDGKVKLWRRTNNDIDSDKYDNFITLEAHLGGVNKSIIDRDQNLLISGGKDGFLRFWDLSTITNGQSQIYLACKRINKHSLLNKSNDLARNVKSICKTILNSD